MSEDKRAIVCNYLETTNVAPKGAKAYVSMGRPGYPDSLCVLVRSHSGRWVSKWERMKRLGNFRFTTLPPEHPRYDDERIADYFEQRHLEDLHELKVMGW